MQLETKMQGIYVERRQQSLNKLCERGKILDAKRKIMCAAKSSLRGLFEAKMLRGTIIQMR